MLKAVGSVDVMPDIADLFAQLAGETRIGVAVSGGADSLALMMLAAQWAQTQDPQVSVIVYTVDHGLRREATAEVAAVKDAAADLGLKVRALKWQGEKPATGIQAAARQARYRFMAAAMAEDGVSVLLTAHHAMDQAETVLMRLAHGSGLSGLGGIKPFSEVEGVRLFRPLLAVPPSALAALVRDAGLEPVVDPSNLDATYERVRWRQLAPALDDLGLGAKRLGLFTNRMHRADDALKNFTEQALTQIASVDAFGTVSINRAGFQGQPLEIQIRILQRVLREVGGHSRPFELADVETLNTNLTVAEYRKVTLLGCTIERTATDIVLCREVARISQALQSLKPGEQCTWDNRFSIENLGKQSITIRSGTDLTRRDFEALTGEKNQYAMASVQVAPVVRNQGGDILSIGSLIFDASIRVLSSIGSWGLTQPLEPKQ